MTLPTNDNFSNRELSIEELDAIAAGSILGSIGDAFKDIGNAFEDAGKAAYHAGEWVVNWIRGHYEGRPQGGPYNPTLRVK